MKAMRILNLLLVVCLLGIVLAGCDQPTPTPEEPPAPTEAPPEPTEGEEDTNVSDASAPEADRRVVVSSNAEGSQ